MSAGSLEGVRVLDFTWSVAGPTMTKILAGLGAEVIKVEWPAHPDPMRSAMYAAGEKVMGLDNGVFFANLNTGKKSLSLDARNPLGLEVVKDLVRKSDIIAEAFSAKVFENWGLSYEELSEINPRIVYISVSGFGHSGRYSAMDTWGPTAQAFNGLTFMSGLPDGEPAGWGWSYMDVVGGYTACLAALVALHHRNETGRGQYIDLAQTESGIPLNGASILDFTVNGRKTRQHGFPPGNRSVSPEDHVNAYRGDMGAPSNVYPTLGGGPNDYCAISVLSDEEWSALERVMGDPDWTQRPEYGTVQGRIDAQDLLDAAIGDWTKQFEKYELMQLLQSNGVRCAAVESPEDRMEHDPQLKHRGIFRELEHPLLGTHRFEAVPFHMSVTDPTLEAHWPILGTDNEYVFKELLRYDPAKIKELDDQGVTWPKGMPRDFTYSNALW